MSSKALKEDQAEDRARQDPLREWRNLRELLQIKIMGANTARKIGDFQGANQCDCEAGEIKAQLRGKEFLLFRRP